MRLRQALVVSLTTLATTATFAASPAADTTNEKDAIARGEYLSKVAHCSACHTSDPAKPFAGGVALASQFGTMYGSNITPEAKTGIGAWSEKDFEGALRRGVGKGKEYLYPSMPYTDFTRISDADVHALYAYFRSVKPIANKVKADDMMFPFDIRPGVAAWQAVFFKQGRFVGDDAQSPEWNRGAYLVQGLGHCGACHSPTNIAMAPKKGKALQGNVVDNWFAPDISGGRYSSLKDWSEADLVTFFRKGHTARNEAAVGPMAQTIELGMSQMTDADLKAIAFYLKHQDPSVDDKPATTRRSVTAQERESGLVVYRDNCASCHGADGKGVAGVAPTLVGAASVAGASPDTAIRSVVAGYAPQGQWGVMPSFGRVLTKQEISDVVNYVRTAWGNAGGTHVDTPAVDRIARNVELDPQVESALVCPSPAAAKMDDATLAAIKAAAPATDVKASTAKVVADYRKRYPGLPRTEVITNISGVFCRDVMASAKGTLAERQTRYVNFMGGVAQAAAR